jgi:hypothetical protein
MLDECPAEQKITDFVEGPRATLPPTWQSGPIDANGVIDATPTERTSTLEEWTGGGDLGARATSPRRCGGGRWVW